MSVATERSIYHYSDSINMDPASPGTADDVTAFLPNILFDY
jgi:hypothetical protein